MNTIKPRTQQEKADLLILDAAMLHGFIATYLREGAIEMSKEEILNWLAQWYTEYAAYCKEYE